MSSLIRCIIFDVDGTLIDSEQHNRAILRATLRECGIHRSTSALDALRGHTLRACYETLAPNVPIDSCLALHQFNERDANTPLAAFDDVHETLCDLGARGIALGVVTSRRRDSLNDVFSQADLHVHFDPAHVLAYEDVAVPKPDPEGVRILMDRLGADPDVTLFVGDTPIDVQTARSAGSMSALILRRPLRAEDVLAEPDMLLQSLLDLRSIAW